MGGRKKKTKQTGAPAPSGGAQGEPSSPSRPSPVPASTPSEQRNPREQAPPQPQATHAQPQPQAARQLPQAGQAAVPVQTASSQAQASTPPTAAPATRPVTGHAPQRFSSAPAQPAPDAAREVNLAIEALGRLELGNESAVSFPLRPGIGKAGTPVKLLANHFVATLQGRPVLYHYDVVIAPIEKPRERAKNKRLCRRVWNALVEQKFAGMRASLVYDNAANCYASRVLLPGKGPFSTDVRLQEEQGARERHYQVTMQEVARRDTGDLMRFYEGVRMNLPQEIVQAFDVALREGPVNRFTSIGRSFFDKTQFGASQNFGNGVEGWPGFYQSLRATQSGLTVNIDQTVSPMLKAQPVMAFVAEFLQLRGAVTSLTDQQRRMLKKALRTVRVEVTHRRPQIARYTIRDISSEPISRLRFESDGQQTTVYDYFRQKYPNVRVLPNMPALQVGAQQVNYMPMDVCNIMPGQRFGPKLNPDQTRAMLKQTAVKPGDRRQRIDNIRAGSAYERDPYLAAFGLSVSAQMATVNGRHLPAPVLTYGKGQTITPDPTKGEWDIRNKAVVKGNPVEAWGVINFSWDVQDNQIATFFPALVKECRSMGIKMSDFDPQNVMYGGEADVNKSMRTAAEQTGYALKLLFVIVPRKFTIHDAVKATCETELGLITQCIVAKNIIDHLTRAKSGFLQNLALKVNTKVGGSNNYLKLAVERRLVGASDCETIIFGADVTHPPPGDTQMPSLAAVVASMDWPTVTQYVCRLRTQSKRKEGITNLAEMASELLQLHKSRNGKYPRRMIFYRDGVSEGQFMDVLVNEVSALREACKKLGLPYVPLTFVVVQKRHHTRFFVAPGGRADKNGNVLPGTVVDRDICHPSEFDFFLNSHASVQGTSKPTHYHVLYDENGFNADALQFLTYSLCYTYARCARSVSIVPPVYYAHLAAAHGRCYLDATLSDSASERSGGQQGQAPVTPLPEVHENLRELMFYC